MIVLIGLLWLCALMMLYIGYFLYGHQLIKNMYDKQSIGILNHLIESQNIHLLSYYYAQADWLFLSLSFCASLAVILMGLALYSSPRHVFYGMVCGAIAYYLIFIFKSSVVIEGVRYFTLFDDAMISMRYAKHLAMGYGLVWNPGDIPVEGYTNFLWVLYMALWHLLPISSAYMALPIQLSGLVFLVWSLYAVRKIAERVSNTNPYVSLGAVALTASYLASNFWGLKGMETSVLTCVVLTLVLRLLVCVEQQRFDFFIFVLLGIGLLLRLDFIPLFITMLGYLIGFDKKNRVKNITAACITVCVIIGGMTVFRMFYYHDILPNTYYLKMTGIPLWIRVHKGLWSIQEFIKKMSIIIWLLPCIYIVLYWKDTRVLLLAGMLFTQLVYTIYVGGDIFEWWHLASRYMLMVMPCFFILLCMMADYIIIKIMQFFPQIQCFSGRRGKKICFTVILCIFFFQLHGGFAQPYFQIHINILNCSGYVYVQDFEHRDLLISQALKKITSPHAHIAVVAAGVIPYFTERYSIDLLGKSDRVIARQQAKILKDLLFVPGHNKYDYSYSVGALKPDVVQKINWMRGEEYEDAYDRYVKNDYMSVMIAGDIFFIRKDSPHILWEQMKRMIENKEIQYAD